MRKRIRKIRESLSLSRPQFSKKIAYSESKIANVEQGRQKPYADLIAAIVNKLGVNPFWLLLGEGNMFEPVNNVGINEKTEDYKDLSPRHKILKDFIDEAMNTWSEDQKIWLDIQISRTIQEYAVYKEAHKQ